MIRRKCINQIIEAVFEMHDHPVCTATHPRQPNWSGNARGRKVHLAKDDKLTLCNMLIDGYIPSSDPSCSSMDKGLCKSCLNAVEKINTK